MIFKIPLNRGSTAFSNIHSCWIFHICIQIFHLFSEILHTWKKLIFPSGRFYALDFLSRIPTKFCWSFFLNIFSFPKLVARNFYFLIFNFNILLKFFKIEWWYIFISYKQENTFVLFLLLLKNSRKIFFISLAAVFRAWNKLKKTYFNENWDSSREKWICSLNFWK